MSQQLARRDGGAIEQAPERALTIQAVAQMTGYELPQIAMIRHNMATSMNIRPENVPLYDIALYCHAARELDLDPLLRQCYWISRQGKGTLQVGIDGYRAIAERSGIYAGSEPPVFRDWTHLSEKDSLMVPGRCQVTVWKIIAGHKCAFTGEAYWDEWYPGPGKEGFMYRKMPRHMLAKDAEAQALRKAFPAMLSKVEYASAIGDGSEVAAPTIEAEEARPEPRRPQPSPAEYRRTIGSFYPDEEVSDAPGSDPAIGDGAQTNNPDSAGALVTDKNHRLWKRWLAAEGLARKAGLTIDTSDVKLGEATEESLEASCAQLEEMIAEARA